MRVGDYDAHCPQRRSSVVGANGCTHGGDTELRFVEREPVASAAGCLEFTQQGFHGMHHIGPVPIRILEAAVLHHEMHCLVGGKRREPRLAACRREQRDGVRRQRRLIDEPPGRALRVRDPYERVAVDHRQPSELVALLSEPVQHRLA